MAAADYAQGHIDEPPPLIRAALQYGQASQDAWLELPAKNAMKMRQLFTAYDAMRGYLAAARQQQTVQWSQQFPQHSDIVTRIIKERKRGN